MPLSDEFEVMKIVESYNLSADAEKDAIDLLHNIADYNESMRVFGKRPPSITHKQHKQNVQKYMELIQPTLFDIDIPTKTEAIKRSLASATDEGKTTFNPGMWANHECKACEC